MRSRTPFFLLVAVAALLAQPPTYRIVHTYSLGGDGGWGYVAPDPPGHRVFLARQNRLMVVDEDSGKLLGEVTGTNAVHGTAIAESSGHGLATSGNDQSATMFDLKTYKPIGKLPATLDADAVASNADGTLTFIHQNSPDRYHVSATVQTPQGARNMGLDPINHRLLLAFAVIVIERNPPVH